MVDVQRSSLVHPGHHLVVGVVEAVDFDHVGLRLHVGIFGIGGVQVVFKHGQSVQVFDLEKNVTRWEIRQDGKEKEEREMKITT